VNRTSNVASEEPAPAALEGSDLPKHDLAKHAPLSVAEGYERWAPIYDHDPNPLLAREERHLLPKLSDLRSKCILDLACGTGRWLEKLIAASGALGVGLDRSEPMLRVAGGKSQIAGRLTRAACEKLPFRSSIFDLAICSFALGHIADLGSIARELARVTKPSADLFVSDLHPEAYDRGWRVGFRDQNTAIQIETMPHSAEETIQAFASSGFSCATQVPLWLGEPEKHFFARAGKSDQFAEASQLPAVLIFHFRRVASPLSIGEAR
jgi:ubiquinone/menaquinone biosynthesis C-methylase UbiE